MRSPKKITKRAPAHPGVAVEVREAALRAQLLTEARLPAARGASEEDKSPHGLVAQGSSITRGISTLSVHITMVVD